MVWFVFSRSRSKETEDEFDIYLPRTRPFRMAQRTVSFASHWYAGTSRVWARGWR